MTGPLRPQPPVHTKSQELLLSSSSSDERPVYNNNNNYHYQSVRHPQQQQGEITWLDLDKIDVKSDGRFTTEVHEMSSSSIPPSAMSTRTQHPLIMPEPVEPSYKTYKRRWFGLLQLMLLNIVVSWDWLTFASVTKTSSQYFDVSETAITWLSTAFLFAFVLVSPLTMFTLHKGPKPAIVAASVLILFGNWIRYVGAKLALFPVVITGQVLIGLAQPFVLAAPTRYSDLWYSDKGRTTATAVASLANPFGGALGQVLAPLWVPSGHPENIPHLVLYVTIISSIATIPGFFIPTAPPTPPSASAAMEKIPIRKSLTQLSGNGTFYLLFIPFAIYVGFFNALSSLLAQALIPYGYTEAEAGIAGAVLIVVGIISAIIISIINDRTHAYLSIIKILIPIVAAMYLAFLFAPPSRSVAAPYAILAILGAASFALMPVTLEYVVEVTYPVSPEVSSTIMWTAGQLLGGVFLIIMGQLKDEEGLGNNPDYPAGNMQRALVFEAIICCLVAVLPFGMGTKMLGLDGDKRNRYNVDVEDGDLAGTLPSNVNR